MRKLKLSTGKTSVDEVLIIGYLDGLIQHWSGTSPIHHSFLQSRRVLNKIGVKSFVQKTRLYWLLAW